MNKDHNSFLVKYGEIFKATPDIDLLIELMWKDGLSASLTFQVLITLPNMNPAMAKIAIQLHPRWKDSSKPESYFAQLKQLRQITSQQMDKK